VLVLWFTDTTAVPAGMGVVHECVQLVSAMFVPGMMSEGIEFVKDRLVLPANAAWAVSEARVPPLHHVLASLCGANARVIAGHKGALGCADRAGQVRAFSAGGIQSRAGTTGRRNAILGD